MVDRLKSYRKTVNGVRRSLQECSRLTDNPKIQNYLNGDVNKLRVLEEKLHKQVQKLESTPDITLNTRAFT